MMAEAQVSAVLADGDVALVRALHPADTAEVLTLHERLTERDRYFRFFGAAPSTLDKLAAGIVAESGPGPGHAAVGCFLHSALIGVAYYEALADPGTAEIALVVDGAAQKHGVATLLLEHLVSIGRGAGIRKFTADVLAENFRMMRAFADLGLHFQASAGGSEREVVLWLDPTDEYLDAVARRDLVADTASLTHLFRPSSIVVIGAGRRPGSVGHAVLANILAGDYDGAVHVVNPNATDILGVGCARGVVLQPMAPTGRELLIGLRSDAVSVRWSCSGSAVWTPTSSPTTVPASHR